MPFSYCFLMSTSKTWTSVHVFLFCQSVSRKNTLDYLVIVIRNSICKQSLQLRCATAGRYFRAMLLSDKVEKYVMKHVIHTKSHYGTRLLSISTVVSSWVVRHLSHLSAYKLLGRKNISFCGGDKSTLAPP